MLLLQEVVGVSPGGEGSWAETHDILAVTVKVSFISNSVSFASTLGLFCLLESETLTSWPLLVQVSFTPKLGLFCLDTRSLLPLD